MRPGAGVGALTAEPTSRAAEKVAERRIVKIGGTMNGGLGNVTSVVDVRKASRFEVPGDLYIKKCSKVTTMASQ